MDTAAAETVLKAVGISQRGVRGWPRCKQTLNLEEEEEEVEESSGSRKLWRKSNEKLFSCSLMPGLEMYHVMSAL